MKQKLAAFWHTRAALPRACYALALLLWLAWGAYSCVDDLGLMPPQSLPVEAFQLIDLVADPALENGYVTTSPDPQMLLEQVTGGKVRTVSYRPTFVSGEPRELCLYYTTRPGQPYSQDRRVFPRIQPDGRYVYTLPHGSLVSLRLDPCSPVEGHPVTLTFAGGTVDLNAPATLPHGWQYFLPSWYQLFCLLLYPALAAAALDWLRAAWRWHKAR